ncbi:hypothetical protein Cni_G16637 [Canna indica]|uniref:Uncharacterized protein n=1 Tax=Canna indica TaxID=4628 RepID=A0AAQ3KFR9_9LILI|nr:hypothetical protein Cni_G16637 [Canna indica]
MAMEKKQSAEAEGEMLEPAAAAAGGISGEEAVSAQKLKEFLEAKTKKKIEFITPKTLPRNPRATAATPRRKMNPRKTARRRRSHNHRRSRWWCSRSASTAMGESSETSTKLKGCQQTSKGDTACVADTNEQWQMGNEGEIPLRCLRRCIHVCLYHNQNLRQ